ncbi:Quinate permease [Vanrija pseudolonga]|uniref:Quinate permease n=1 Tax=Vanrija pseudolonga TaxID=143232 RepID=A0AAF0YBY0_9TREE|nr:Quinate permease [Vanrija pseudolonga]
MTHAHSPPPTTTTRAWLPCVAALLSFTMYAVNQFTFSQSTTGALFLSSSLTRSMSQVDRSLNNMYITRVVAFICTGFLITPGVLLLAGRRGALLIGSGIVLIAGIVLVAAIKFLAADYAATALLAIGHGIAVPSALLYAAELAPTLLRGKILAFANLAWALGYLVVYWVFWGITWAFTDKSNEQIWPLYRGCASFMFLFSIIVPVSMLFAPNTPPLGSDGHGDGDASRRPLATVVAAGFPAKRVALAFALNALASMVGTSEVSRWSTLVYSRGFSRNYPISSHFGPSLASWIVYSVDTVVGVLGAAVGLLLIDKIGRRKLLIAGSAVLALCMVIIGGLGAGYGSSRLFGTFSYSERDEPKYYSAALGYAVMDVVTTFVAGATWNCVVWVYTAEMFAPAVGTWAVPMSFMVSSISSAIFNHVAFNKFAEKVGLHIFFFFFGLNILVALFVFFFLPETKGVPLENMEELFTGSARHAHRLDIQHIDSNDKRDVYA